MIKININKNYIEIKGHAMYDDFGKDIVCASISSIAITSINVILRINKNAIEVLEDEGYLKINIKSNDKYVNLVIDNMIDEFNELAIQYPKNIKVEEATK